MTNFEDEGGFELQTKRWTKLIELRQALTAHKMDSTGVDIAIANVFDPKKGQIIDSIIVDGNDLMAMLLQLEELQIDSTNVKMTLAKAFVPGASATYAADLAKLKGMIKMRVRMIEMGIPTGCIEATIADVFKPMSIPAKIVKHEEASEASATTQPSLMGETIEPAELDASDTAITKQSAAGVGKPAELEASEAAVTTQPLSSTGAGKPVESPSRPSEQKPLSKNTETSKPAEMPSQPTTMKPQPPDAEHITIIGTSIEAMDLDSSPAVTSPPLTKAASVLTSPSTVRSTPSTKTASSFSSPSTTSSKPSLKRSGPTDTGDALGSAQNPICLGSSPTPKRQRTANDFLPRAALRKTESWRVPILSVWILGLHLKPKDDDTDMSIAFDAETQRVVFYKGQVSLTALYSDLEISPETLLSVTRPTYAQSKHLKVRFMWLNTGGEEKFLDIMVATKQDCRELIARMKGVTSFSENLSSEDVASFLSHAFIHKLKESPILDPAWIRSAKEQHGSSMKLRMRLVSV